MALANNQRKTLRQALMKAYLDEEELQLMLEDELDVQLNTICQSQTYNLTVQNLIKWAEQEGNLRELVIGASKANSGNPELRTCVQDLLPVFLDDIDQNLFKSELLIALIHILKLFSDFAVVKDCCRLTIEDLSIHRPQALRDMDNPKLASEVKWLIVLGLFLKDYPKKLDGTPYIVDFLSYFQGHVKQQSISQSLRDWLEQVKQDYDYPIVNQTQDTPAPEIVSIQGRLLIVVHPTNTATSGKQLNPSFLVNRFICIETIQSDRSIQSQLIPPQEDELSVDSAEFSQRGGYCTLKEIEKNILTWVHQAEMKLGNEAYKLGCAYDLTIEFFLPYEYLAQGVDRWQVPVHPLRLRRFTPVGRQHRVVVRSLDRMEDSELFNRLLKTWLKREQFLQNNPSLKEIKAAIEPLDCPVGCNWEELAGRLQVSQRIALKMTCDRANCTAREHPKNALNELFISLLEAGTPIALWSRQCNRSSSDVASQMEQLLGVENIGNLDQLLEQVKQTRITAANEQDLGQHLAILCDEPERLRQLKQFLEKNKLWEMSA